MIERSYRTLAIVLALTGTTPLSVAAAQTLSFGSETPAVAGGDSAVPKPTDAKPAAKPAAKPDSTPKPEFKPSWNFGVWLFGAYTYQTDSATKANNSNNATSRFSVDRAYLTFRGQVAEDFGFRVTTDVKTLPAGNAVYNGLVVRLKYAYLQWDYLHSSENNAVTGWARIGQIHTVVIDDEERFWPRWLQKTALEYWGVQPSSADEGASTNLSLPNKWGQFYFTIGNGGGYETAVDADRYKDVAGRLDITPFAKSTGRLKTLTITPWYQIGETQSGLAGLIKAGLQNNAGGVFIGMNDPALTWGLEYGERSFETQPVGAILTTDGVVKDGFIQVRPSIFKDPKGTPWGIVVRYDKWTASTTGVTPTIDRTLWIAGVFLDVAKSSSFGITYTDDKGNATTNAPQKTYVQLNWQVTF